MLRSRWLTAALLALLAAAPSAHAAGPPIDWRTNPNLSEPVYEIERTKYEVKMHDGINLYVEVVKPKAPGRYPTILEASPYHGTLADRDGTRILPEPKDDDGKSIGMRGTSPRAATPW